MQDNPCPVPKSYVDKFKGLHQVFNEKLKNSKLEELECVTLQLMHKIDTNQVQVGDTEADRLVKLMLSKISNELWGLVGTLRYGGYYASFHHARSILESYAGLAYVFTDASKQEKRIRKFTEYESVYKLNHYREWIEKLESNEIDEEEFEEACQVSEDEFEELKEKEENWIDLYSPRNDDLSKVRTWHSPAYISNLFDFTKHPETLRSIYASLSHGTHFSPFGYNLTGGFFLIGYPLEDGDISMVAVDKPIKAALLSMHYLDEFMRANLDLDFDIQFSSNPAEWV